MTLAAKHLITCMSHQCFLRNAVSKTWAERRRHVIHYRNSCMVFAVEKEARLFFAVRRGLHRR